LETADAVALNAVFEVSGMTRTSPLACMSSDFRTGDGSRERISCRIPFTLTPDPRVASTGSGHSLISSGSSLSLLFVFVLGISQQMVPKGARVNGTWDDFPRSRSEEAPYVRAKRTHCAAATAAARRYATARSRPRSRRGTAAQSRTG